MTRLLLRNIPSTLYASLEVHAAKNGRSVAEEAIHLLERALLENRVERTELPLPFQGRFAINNEWLDEAKRNGR